MKKTKKQIVVRAFTSIAKPQNTSIQKNSTMLLLGEIPYINGSKTFSTKLYYLKGLRGMLRHACMDLAHDRGIEVCHSSERNELKDGTKLISQGFHALGDCDPPCIIRRIFGTFREKSRVIVSADPITSISHKDYTTEIPVQKVHIASENRIALSYDRIPIQDFRESYFSGYFTFTLDVTQLTEDETKFLVESLLYVEYYGGGRSAGYGHVKILDVEPQQVVIERKFDAENGKLKIVEQETFKPLKLDNINVWIGNLAIQSHDIKVQLTEGE
ncbi:MAG: RAMP superfamily CRISPR-associated protein [Promethearchaeota archaeon]